MKKTRVLINSGLGILSLFGLMNTSSVSADTNDTVQTPSSRAFSTASIGVMSIPTQSSILPNWAKAPSGVRCENQTTKFTNAGGGKSKIAILNDSRLRCEVVGEVRVPLSTFTTAQRRSMNQIMGVNSMQLGGNGLGAFTRVFTGLPNLSGTNVYNTQFRRSQNSPIKLSRTNWNNEVSVMRHADNFYDTSGRWLAHSVKETLFSHNSTNNTIRISGWATQGAYAPTTQTNHETGIVAVKAGTNPNSTSAENDNFLSLQVASKTNKNPKKNFYWNSAYDRSKKCLNLDVYLDSPISYSRLSILPNGTERFSQSESYSGCWWEQNYAGFNLNLNLNDIIGKDNLKADLYIANSKGNDSRRIIYRGLSTFVTRNSNFDDGKVKGSLQLTASARHKQGVQTYVHQHDARVFVKRNSSGDLALRNGSPYIFPDGNYRILGSEIDSDDTVQFRIRGTGGATSGVTGWISVAHMSEDPRPAQLSLTIDQESKVTTHFVKKDAFDNNTAPVATKINNNTLLNNNKLKNATTHTLRSNSRYYNPKISNNNRTLVDGNGVTWQYVETLYGNNTRDNQGRLVFNASGNGDFYRDNIVHLYEKQTKVKVNFINANTGETIYSQEENIPAGATSRTFTYNGGGLTNSGITRETSYRTGSDRDMFVRFTKANTMSNTTNARNKIWKYAGDGNIGDRSNYNSYSNAQRQGAGVRNYSGGNRNSQNITLAQAGAGQEVNFYFYEPQTFTIEHHRTNNTGTYLNNNGGTTTMPANSRIVANENYTVYSGETVQLRAYNNDANGTKSAVRTNAFNQNSRQYRFAGRAKLFSTANPNTQWLSDIQADNGNGWTVNGTSDIRRSIARGNANLTAPLLKVATQNNFGSKIELLYRRIVTDPSGTCDLTTNTCTPNVTGGQTPNTPQGKTSTGTNRPNRANASAYYAPSVQGQTNWYLAKPNDATSTAYKETNLMVGTDNRLGNQNVFAVAGFRNDVYYNNTRVGGSNVDSGTIYYNQDLANNRFVQRFVGDGVNLRTMSRMNLPTRTTGNGRVTGNNATKNSSLQNSNALKNLSLNVKSTVSGLSQAGKSTGSNRNEIRVETNYNYLNRFRDIYVANETYNGNTFSWRYDRTELGRAGETITSNANNFETKIASQIDHKLGDVITENSSQEYVSKVGIYTNYTQLTGNMAFGANGTNTTLGQPNSSNRGTTLYERIRRTTANASNVKKLNTQTRLAMSEPLSYTNDLVVQAGGNLHTASNAGKFNDFIYQANGYNRALYPEVDFNFRGVTGNATTTNLSSRVSPTSLTGTTAINNQLSAKNGVPFKYQTGATATPANTNALTSSNRTKAVNVNLTHEFGVLQDSGYLVQSGTNGRNLFRTGTGYTPSDSDNVVGTGRYYYIPIDVESSLDPNTTYTNRYFLNNVGLASRQVVVDKNFSYDKYLIGDALDNSTYASYKTELVRSGNYGGNVLMTPEEQEWVNENVTEDSEKNFRMFNTHDMINKLKDIVGFKNN